MQTAYMILHGMQTYWDIVSVIFLETIQELHISQQSLGGSPVVLNLLARARGVIDTIRLDVSHDTDGCHDQLDARGRVLHGLDDGDVSRFEGIEGSQGRLKSWDSFSKLTFTLMK